LEFLMNVLFSVLAVAFPSFCVWLGLRILNRRERWAKRLAVGLVAALPIYPLSLGPVCWWLADPPPDWLGCSPFPKVAPNIYWPIGWVAEHSPVPVLDAIIWYAAPGKYGRVFIPSEYSGEKRIYGCASQWTVW